MPRLVVGKGKSKGKVVDLKPGVEVVVGRELSNKFPIRDAQASRRHFRLVAQDDNQISVEDLGSVNGTWVNGTKTVQATVSVGDKIRAGETIMFVIGDNKPDDQGELTGSELAGYKIGNLLGRGGMGSVYAAQQLSLDRKVAFKVLAKELAQDVEFVKSFLEEARAAGRLNHQNIVQVYDVGEVGGTFFYSLELMSKGSVEDLINQEGKLSVETVLPIAIDAARGLEYAEKKGLIHRDIKPANLFLSGDDVTKIGDLGIAQRFEAEVGAADQERVSGSPHYIAPEQALGKAIDGRADLYALGVSLFEMLAGEVPYAGRSPQEIILKHINSPTPLLKDKRPDLPESVCQIVGALMEKDPAKRIVNASQLLSLLVPLLDEFPPRTTALIRLQADLSASSGRLQQAGDVAPLPPGLKASERLPETRSKTWTKVAMGAVSVFLLGCVVLGVVGAISKSRKGWARREAQLGSLDQSLANGNFKVVSEEARKLEKSFSQDGYPELSQRARKLAEDAEKKLADQQQAAQEEAARKAYLPLAKAVEQLDRYKNNKVSLEKVIKALTRYLKDHQESVVAKKARADLTKVQLALEDLERELERRKAEADEQRKILGELARRLKLKTDKRQFGDAFDILSRFREKHPDEKYQTAATALEAEVEKVARKSLGEFRRRELNPVVARGDFSQARRLLRDFQRVVNLENTSRQFQSMLTFINQAEAASKRAEQERLKKNDETLYASVADEVNKAVRERAFDRAARAIRGILVKLQVKSIEEQAERRALLFERAERAKKQLIDHVNSKRRDSKVNRLLIWKGKEKQCPAVEANAEALFFETEPGVALPRRFEKFKAAELLGFFDKLKLNDEQRLDLACLAWAIGQQDDARAWVGQLSTFTSPAVERVRLGLKAELNS